MRRRFRNAGLPWRGCIVRPHWLSRHLVYERRRSWLDVRPWVR